jgi:hypothetical protein
MDMSKLNALSTEQLRVLNRAVVGILNTRNSNEAFEKSRQFRIGQTVQFRDKKGGVRKIVIERINTKSVSGLEVGGYMTWRVHPNLLSAVL